MIHDSPFLIPRDLYRKARKPFDNRDIKIKQNRGRHWPPNTICSITEFLGLLR